ncbi:hypothetical protein LTR16_010444, partial [Cryomyces antarcticus]
MIATCIRFDENGRQWKSTTQAPSASRSTYREVPISQTKPVSGVFVSGKPDAESHGGPQQNRSTTVRAKARPNAIPSYNQKGKRRFGDDE